jgi:hypothetical protein
LLRLVGSDLFIRDRMYRCGARGSLSAAST